MYVISDSEDTLKDFCHYWKIRGCYGRKTSFTQQISNLLKYEAEKDRLLYKTDIKQGAEPINQVCWCFNN